MFILSTDTCIDLPKYKLDELNIKYLVMKYTRDGKEFPDDFNSDEDYARFYKYIDDGALIKTSQCSQYETEEHFRRLLREEKGDLLHICLSSGISGTYNNTKAAAKTIMSEEEFAGRAIFAVDTRSGSCGQYLLNDIALKMRDEGRTAEETFNELNKQAPNLQHWVYIDDLTCLKRGGRIGTLTAVIGSVLHIKPVAIVNAKGEIRIEKKFIGMRKALNFIADRIAALGEPFTEIDGKQEEMTVYISHANCFDKVKELIDLIKERIKCKFKTTFIGPLIGAHTGPGSMGIFFLGKPRFAT